MTFTEEETNRRVSIMSKVNKYFEDRYGEERALVIIKKIATYFSHDKNPTVLEAITLGDKWHFANLLFNNKITTEEFTQKFPQ